MQDIAGRTAFITGGASGIGLAMAQALAAAGARIALADVDAARLAEAAEGLKATGADVATVRLDVADAAAWDGARDAVEQALGPVQILCNNAGVGTGANSVADLPVDHWSWSVGVNLNGVFFGARTFAARMRALKLPGHIVNTASIMGLMPIARQPAYVATKYAVVGLSEVMRIDLAAENIGVSVLCPGLVSTPLRAHSLALRPGGGREGFGFVAADGKLAERPPGMEAGPIGAMVVEAIRANRFYVFPHPEYRDLVAGRAARLSQSFRDPAEAGYREDTSYLGGDCARLFDQEL